jgi:signal transduction histidine kinase
MRYDKQNKKLERLSQQVTALSNQNVVLKLETDTTREILINSLHEIRRFSAQLSKFCERISRDTQDNPGLNQAALSALYTAGMISSRLAYTDIELNPRAIESQTPVRSGIFKKFDKAKRILAEEAKNNSVVISLIGESRTEIDALPVFELLPFVILDNAIKYSPQSQAIEVIFEKVAGKQLVTVKSCGPDVADDEMPKLFEKGFRGSLTKPMPGEGLGLFLAKRVCDFHGIFIRAEVQNRGRFHFNGICYSEFLIVIQFQS